MALYLSPKTVLYNAFYSRQETDGQCAEITIENLRAFCNRLYDAITGNTRNKYVVLGVDDESIEEFMDRNDDFIKGITKIVCTRRIRPGEVKGLNAIYENDVQAILDDSRKLWGRDDAGHMEKRTEQEKQHIIDEVNATMAMENMPLTDEDRQRMKRYLDGEITIDEAMDEILKECKR